MRNIWQDSGLTIVVLPSGLQGDELYRVAKLWTELRMLSTAIWVRHELLEPFSTTPPKQRALVLGVEQGGGVEEIEVDLFEQLARQPLNLVRLLVVRTATPNIEFDQKQDILVNLLSDYLLWSLPAAITQGNSPDKVVDFVKINLITAPTEYKVPVPDNYRRPNFNAHFIAAAEDRATPSSGDAFVRDEPHSEKFAGFTMLHVGSLGGLWVGLPQGTYEMVKPGAFYHDKAFVTRVFLSSILTDGLARRASSRVLERAGNPQSGFVDLNSEIPIEGTVPIPANQIDGWVDWMISQVFSFDQGVLTFQRAASRDDADQTKITLGRQFNEFGKFCLDKMARVPYFAGLWIYRGLVQIVNTVFQGGNKGSSIIPIPEEKMDKRDQLVLQALSEVSEVKAKADAALVSPVTPSHVKSSPELWSKIRKLLFGVLDGSNLDQFGVERTENGWPVMYQVASVFNDPSRTYGIRNPEDVSSEDLIEVSWEDQAQFTEFAEKFAAKRAALDTENQSDLANLVGLNTDLEATQARLATLQSRLEEILPPSEPSVDGGQVDTILTEPATEGSR